MPDSVTDWQQRIHNQAHEAGAIASKLRQQCLDNAEMTNQLIQHLQEAMKSNENLVKLLEQKKRELDAEKQATKRYKCELQQTQTELDSRSSQLAVCQAVKETLQKTWDQNQEVRTLESQNRWFKEKHDELHRDLTRQTGVITALKQDLRKRRRDEQPSTNGDVESGTTDEQ
jgi:hypothetical protein